MPPMAVRCSTSGLWEEPVATPGTSVPQAERRCNTIRAKVMAPDTVSEADWRGCRHVYFLGCNPTRYRYRYGTWYLYQSL